MTRIALLAASMLLVGCASLPPLDLDGTTAELPSQVRLNAPAHPATEFYCGPAALATLLNHSGVSTDPEQLAEAVYIPGRRGTLQTELRVAARRHGRIPYLIPPTTEALLQELAAGQPVLVLQNLGFRRWPHWHYAVAVGYDLERQRITLHTGERAWFEAPAERFLSSWRKAGGWALVIPAPGTLPATAAAGLWLREAARLEAAGELEFAAAAYAAALERWPGRFEALMGLGNIAYAEGALEQAAHWFAAAATHHPEAAAPRNNLAHVLAAQGDLEGAEAQAREAIARGGRFGTRARQTLADIERRRSAQASAADGTLESASGLD